MSILEIYIRTEHTRIGMDFKDIKTWGVLLSIVVAIGGGFSKFGSMSTRLDIIEAKSSPDIKPIVQDISDIKKNIAVLKKDIEQLREKESNPLLR